MAVVMDETIKIQVADHEIRIKELETVVPKLEFKMETMAGSINDLKRLSMEQHKEAMELFRNVIQHNQTMDQVKTQFKQEMAKIDLEIKRQRMEAEEKQKEETAKMKRDLINKMILWGTPIVTSVATVIVKLIEKFM